MTMYESGGEAGGSIAIGDVPGIIRRRRVWVVAPFVVGTLAATIAAFTLPPVYKSSSTMLIESQQIPTSLVGSPFSAYADERIAKIRQQILSRTNLLALMDDNRLYADLRAELTPDEVLAKMRAAIGVDLVSASAGNAQNRGGNTTIAFTLSYSYVDPERAYEVATQLTEMFINEDKRLRIEQASGAATFLKSRADELRDRLIEIENKRRSIQARFAGALPDQALVSAQGAAALRSELSRFDGEIQSIMQQNSLLAARTQDALAVAESPGQAEVRRAQLALDRLVATLSNQHPDVVAARNALDAATLAARNEPPPRLGMAAITGEIQAGRARIAALGRRRQQVIAAIADIDRLVARSPQAAYELNNLDREQENLKQQYTDIREKQLEAQVAENLQTEDKAERFSVVDPPTVSSQPVSPNRIQLILMGAVGGLAAGLGLIIVWEVLTGCIHGAGAIARLTGEPPMATIPMLRPGPAPSLLTRFDRMMLWRRRRVAA